MEQAEHIRQAPRTRGAEAIGRVSAAWLDPALVLLGAALSLAATGFVFGLDNNLFQLPILGRLYDLPQFADDPFQQSLRHYASGVWRLLEGSDRWIAPTHLLLALAVGARLLAFAGFLACAAALGVRTAGQKLLFVALLAGLDLMLGYSYAGSQGLFLNHVTHSELANGFLLLSFASAARRRLSAALAFAGAVFFCNAFMGVWALAVVGGMALWMVAGGAISLAEAARRLAPGAAIFAALALPVVLTIVGNPEFGASTPIDYRDYLTGYWPKHFLIWTVPAPELIGLGLVIVLAALSLATLGRRAAPFRVIFAVLAGLYAAGVAAPFLTGSQAILNLHLLRVGGPLQMVAALGALAVVVRFATSRDMWRARLVALAMALSLCALPAATLLAIAALLLDRIGGPVRSAGERALGGRFAALGAAACLALIAALGVERAVAENGRNARLEALVSDWREVALWARANTPANAVFLTPSIDLSRQSVGLPYDRALAPIAATGADFEYVAQRRVFVDFKRGGAAPWTPSYYAHWRPRIDEALALKTLAERRSYAARVGAGYVVDRCADEPPAFRAGALCVYAAA